MNLFPEQQSWETQQGRLELPTGDNVESAMLIGTVPTSIACNIMLLNNNKCWKDGYQGHRSILSLSAA